MSRSRFHLQGASMAGFSLFDLIRSQEDFEGLAAAARQTDNPPRWSRITYAEFLRDYRPVDDPAPDQSDRRKS